MDAAPQLWMFFLMVFGIVVLPGMDMAVVMANALAGGRARGMLALAGVIAGGVCHVVASALGIGLIVQAFPAVFNTMLLAGAAYVAWIGWSLWRHAGDVRLPMASAASGRWATFRQAALTNLLNPKAYLFMLAVFPQFLRPGRGDVWMQSALLWFIIGATQAAVYGGVALAAAGAGGLAQRPRTQLLLARGAAGMLMAGAAWTAWEGLKRR
ncbi:MAG: LysE family translocator [Pseudomonadota bacterium]